MQVVFDQARKVKREILVSFASMLTGYSKDAVRIAFEVSEKRETEKRHQIELKTQQILEQRREQGGGTERRG